MDKLKLTSVKILESLYLQFKKSCLDDEFTLQKFVNRSLDLYSNDETFREKVLKYDKLEQSGSMI
jgi:hypothetical protein